jgi:hypothetical protein
MLPLLQNVFEVRVSLSTISETTAVPPRLQLIRRGHCRGHRFRRRSIGMNCRLDCVPTTSLSATFCTGFRLSNAIRGRAFSKFVSDCRNSNSSRSGNGGVLAGGFRKARSRERRMRPSFRMALSSNLLIELLESQEAWRSGRSLCGRRAIDASAILGRRLPSEDTPACIGMGEPFFFGNQRFHTRT